MTTFLLRHASTSYSTRYLVNGDPDVVLPLNAEGIIACGRLRSTGSLSSARTWITSGFQRAKQTSQLLSGTTRGESLCDPRLNELDYGNFEGRPFLDYAAWLQFHGSWARPPGSAESQSEGIARMLAGVQAALTRPGPHVVVAHGLLLSVLTWALTEPPGSDMPLFFPEAACLDPLVVSDARLSGVAGRLIDDVNRVRDHIELARGAQVESGRGRKSVLANFDSLRTPPEERHPHA